MFRSKERAELERRVLEAQHRLAQAEAEAEERAGRDHVTGLLNLRSFNTRLEAEVDRARRHGRPLALGLLDVDDFRAVNTHYGHVAGDEALLAVGRVLSRYTRLHDVICRVSADEFGIVLPETEASGAEEAFERMLLELEALEVGPIQCVSASVGIAAFDRSMTPAQLLGKGAEALDRARAAGGGRVFVFTGEHRTEEPEDDTRHAAVTALAASLLERDRYTGEHSESLIQMTQMVARGMGLGPDQVKQIKTAALLHDIGKVGIPDQVLRKPAKLDEHEWALMKEHPVIGERILRAIPGLGGVARIVRHEHERWDGKGYPDGLEGEEIPVGSRIILACDAYHAMTSDRPYRAALEHSVAVDQLVEGAGSQFDPAVTEILIGCLYSLRQASLTS